MVEEALFLRTTSHPQPAFLVHCSRRAQCQPHCRNAGPHIFQQLLPMVAAPSCRRFDGMVPGPQGDKGAEAVAALGVKVAALVEQFIAGEALLLECLCPILVDCG